MSQQDGPRRDLAPVGEVLDVVLGRFAGAKQRATLDLFAQWEEIAGPGWEQSRPVKIVEAGVLVVEVPDGASASKLRFGSDELVAAINAALGEDVVTGVRLRVGGRRG
jgi:hypothetical protein